LPVIILPIHSSQGAFKSEEYLEQNKVAAKRVYIPRKWLVCNACLELKQFGEGIEKKVRMGDTDEKM